MKNKHILLAEVLGV